MSIYATLWVLKLEDDRGQWHMIFGQGVPGHIQHAGEKWAWLPPPVSEGDRLRAVVIVTDETPKGTARCPQEYHEPLLILSAQEYAEIAWPEMLKRIQAALIRPSTENQCAVCSATTIGTFRRMPLCMEHLASRVNEWKAFLGGARG